MEAFHLIKPGDVNGPCDKPCQHSQCAMLRITAETLCEHCNKPIGYETGYIDMTDTQTASVIPRMRLIHAACYAEQTAPFKVGDRVEADCGVSPNATPPRWKLGRIVGTGGQNGKCWQVHLDEQDNILDHILIPMNQASDRLIHSAAPMPDKGLPLSDRQKRSGRFEVPHVCQCGHAMDLHDDYGAGECLAKVWNAGASDPEYCGCVKFSDRSHFDPTESQVEPPPELTGPTVNLGFKVGDILERTEGGVLNQYEIQSIAGDMITYQRIVPDTNASSTVPLEWLAGKIMRGEVIYKSIDTRTKGNQLPKSVTPYEPKFGDMFWAGEEIVKVLSVNSEQVLLERSQGVPIKYSIQYLRNSLAKGLWVFASQADQIKYLEKESDRLDTIAANAVEQRARIVERINALKAAQG